MKRVNIGREKTVSVWNINKEEKNENWMKERNRGSILSAIFVHLPLCLLFLSCPELPYLYRISPSPLNPTDPLSPFLPDTTVAASRGGGSIVSWWAPSERKHFYRKNTDSIISASVQNISISNPQSTFLYISLLFSSLIHMILNSKEINLNNI